MSELDFAPKFRPREPPKFTDTAWLDYDEPQVILFQGMRGSGKGVSVESTAEKQNGPIILEVSVNENSEPGIYKVLLGAEHPDVSVSQFLTVNVI